MKWFALLIVLPFLSKASAQGFTAEKRDRYNAVTAVFECTDRQNFDFTTFYRNGLKMEKGRIRNGQKQGLWKRWNEDGTLYAVARFKNGLKTGRWKFFNHGEKRMIEIDYKDNLIITAREKKYNPLLAMY